MHLPKLELHLKLCRMAIKLHRKLHLITSRWSASSQAGRGATVAVRRAIPAAPRVQSARSTHRATNALNTRSAKCKLSASLVK